ncbi:hypothetical protein GCM10010466_06890 [Planomonospora alba]|uniref:Uncharacterized protein n=1 Tax=Planomonospora alba TaxID=161354 RepID=A0ABP6MQ43_9ACTN
MPVTGRLARELIKACTRLGDLVIDLQADTPAVVSGALSLGRRVTACTTDLDLAEDIWESVRVFHPVEDLPGADLRFARPEDTYLDLAHLRGRAALIVARHTCRRLIPGGPATLVNAVAEPAALLKAGGHLAVITGLRRQDGRAHDPAPELVRQAREAGLVYLQHIVALRIPARPDAYPAAPTQAVAVATGLTGTPGVPTARRAHCDVLLFAKPHGKEAR